MIGLDTNAIIDLFKGKNEIKRILSETEEPLVATQMSYLELQFGLNPEERTHQMEEKYYDEFFKTVMMLELTSHACKKAAEIHWRLKKKGAMIGKFDCIIAGMLLINGVNKIITKNKKDFEKIAGISVIEY